MRKVNYSETNFINDYTLLEDAGRILDSAARLRQSAIARPNGKNPARPPGISKGRMSMLTKEAAKRNINLRFMPRGFARHARNSSHVRSIPEPDVPPPPSAPQEKKDPREKAMFWHLDLYFASCSDKSPGTKLVKVDACEEEQRIEAILLGATGALKKGRKRKRSDAITCTSKANDGYAKYLCASPDDLVVFLRNEHVLAASTLISPATSPRPVSTRSDKFDLNRYVPIHNAQSLRQALSGRSVVEFPVLHVAFEGSKQAKELACATSGIFEKPDETDDSDSASSAESESEEEDGHVPEPVEPKPPTTEAASAEKPAQPTSFSGISSVDGQQEPCPEPLLKARRLESPPSVAPTASPSDLQSTANSGTLSINGKQEEGSKIRSPITMDNHTADEKPISISKEVDPSKSRFNSHGGKWKEGEGRGPRSGINPEDFGTSESESFAVDPHGMRGSGLSLEDPFMRESVKAILETRIPRKRREDKPPPCSSSSDKQSPPRKLAATGW